MRLLFMAVAAVCVAGVAYADSSGLDEGILIAHYAPSLTYTSDTPPDGWGAELQGSPDAISSCADQINRIDGPVDHAMWFIISAWDENKVWCTTQLGIEGYDPTVWLFQSNGPVYPEGGAGLEIYTNAFPSGDPVGQPSGVIFGPDDGSWGPTDFEPVWWFEGYAYGYGYGTTLVQLGEDPATQFGGWFNCENPPGEYAAASFGAMGVNRDGVYACFPGAVPGSAACCVGQECQILPEEDCANLQGLWFPARETCTPSPCEEGSPPVAACCMNGECFLLVPEDCHMQGGDIYFEFDTCDPGLCDPEPVRHSSWGRIKALYR